MIDNELAYSSASDLVRLIAAKEVSPVELTDLFFRRIDQLDTQLNSFLLLTRDEAIQTARAAEDAVMRGDELGPLHGLPIAIKDTHMTKGVRTTFGSLLFKDRVPERDAGIVERIKGAGGIMLGKTNTSEFALIGMCDNRLGTAAATPGTRATRRAAPAGAPERLLPPIYAPWQLGATAAAPFVYPPACVAYTALSPPRAECPGIPALRAPPCPTYSDNRGP